MQHAVREDQNKTLPSTGTAQQPVVIIIATTTAAAIDPHKLGHRLLMRVVSDRADDGGWSPQAKSE